MDVNDLIKGLKTHINFGTDCDDCPFKDDVHCFVKLVEEVSKVLEEKLRPQGEWSDYYYPYFEIPGIKCSICNKDVEYWERHHEKPNFCPNCGAQMKKGDNTNG